MDFREIVVGANDLIFMNELHYFELKWYLPIIVDKVHNKHYEIRWYRD